MNIFRSRIRKNPLVVGFLLVVSLGLLTHAVPFVRTAELKALDNQFEILRQIVPKDVERDVVVIGIDEETTKVFREPYTLWHVHFGRLFEALG